MYQEDESVNGRLKAIRALMHAKNDSSDMEILELTEDDLYDEQQDENFIPHSFEEDIQKKIADINENLTQVKQDIEQVAKTEEDIITAETAAKSIETLKQLIQKLEKTTAQAYKPRSVTVEEVVSETIKPYLKDWLSQYLHSIVQGAVDLEVQKLVIKKE